MYQFIHIETYAEIASAKGVSRRNTINKKGQQNSGTKSLLNLRQIIAEAKREPGAHPHIPNPQQPIKIYGLDLDLVEQMAVASKIGQVDSKGRKLRSDTPILLAGISSYPRDEYELAPDKFDQWLQDTVSWLQQQYGDSLKNVTLHRDEEHPHIHFYAVSPDGRAKHLHAGYQAEIPLDKKDNKGRTLAHKAAMRLYQDQYYMEVAAKNGMLRDGPRRLRKSRAVDQAEKAHAKILSAKIREIEETDQIVAASFEDTYHEIVDQAKKESARHAECLMAETIQEATTKSNSMIDAAKLQVEQMLENARIETNRIRNEIMQWSKNTLENMRRLATAEEKVKSLNVELLNTRGQLEYFAEENRELKRKLIALPKK
jgi:hypothetical protein